VSRFIKYLRYNSVTVNHPASTMARGRGRRPVQQQPAPRPTAGRRAAPVNFREDPGSGEDFDFTHLDDEQSADEDVQHVQRPISPASVEPAAGSAASTRPVTPSEQASESSRSRTAPDIDFLYERGSKVPPITRTLCKTCKYVILHIFIHCPDKDCCLGPMG
jgi:hypothetical protein